MTRNAVRVSTKIISIREGERGSRGVKGEKKGF